MRYCGDFLQMSERRRIRKVVDYAKFECDDIDDDDFSLSNPSKRTKTEKSASSLYRVTDSTLNSKSEKPSVSRLASDINQSDVPKIILPKLAQSSSCSPSSLSSAKSLTTNKENCAVNVGTNHNRSILEEDEESSREPDFTKESTSKSNSDVADSLSEIPDHSSDDSIIEDDIKVAAGNKQRPITQLTVYSDEGLVAVTKKGYHEYCASKTLVKGTTLANRRDSIKSTGASSGLRLGLSRSAKVKPLHGNVKS